MNSKHLVFFDGNCGLCNLAVRHIINIDGKRHFLFSPLDGEVTRAVLKNSYEAMLKANTMILVENYKTSKKQVWIRSRAILRIYWIVGGKWKIPGILSFLPGCLGDFFYRLFALYRYRLNIALPKDSIPKDRFLS